MKKQAKILIIDGDPAYLERIAGFLDEEYNIRKVFTCAELYNTAQEFHPDIVISAAFLPDKECSGMLPLLKRLFGEDTPLLITINSQHSANEDLQFLSDANDFLLKPFSATLVKKRIEVHLLLKLQQRQIIRCTQEVDNLVKEKTKTVTDLQNAIVRCLTDAVEHRGQNGTHTGLAQKILAVMLDGMRETSTYTDEISCWDIPLFMLASYLHDVGKVAVADHILLKPGALSPEEFELMEKHTEYGESMIDKMGSILGAQEFIAHAKAIIAAHHEKWDGTGYPKGLVGLDIPLQGRMMAIVDVYEALVSARPYKTALCHEEAVKIIDAGHGRHFDPSLVAVFMHISGRINDIVSTT